MSAAARRMAHAHIGRHPEESARVLERLETTEIAELLRDAPTKSVATVISKFAPSVAGACMACLPSEERSAVLALLPVPIAAALLRPLESAAREEALGGLPEGSRAALERALSYPEQSAGALADPSAVALHADLTVEEATARVRERPGATPSRIFVLDRSQRLLGSVTPATLLDGSPKATVGSLDHRRRAWCGRRGRRGDAARTGAPPRRYRCGGHGRHVFWARSTRRHCGGSVRPGCRGR